MSQTSAEFIEVFLKMRHEADTEGVAGVQPLLLHQEVHGLGQTLVVANPEGLHTAGLTEPGLDLLSQLAAVLFSAGMVLEVFDMFDRHLDDLRLLDPAAALLEVGGRDESAEVRQAVVHAVAAALLYDSV